MTGVDAVHSDTHTTDTHSVVVLNPIGYLHEQSSWQIVEVLSTRSFTSGD